MHQTGKDHKDDSVNGRRHNHSQMVCMVVETRELYTEQLDSTYQNYKSTFDLSVSPSGIYSVVS